MSAKAERRTTGTWSLTPSKNRVLKVLGWLDLILGGPLLIISVIALLAFLVEILTGSVGQDHVGDLGTCVVIVLGAGPAVWAGSSMAFKGVHVSQDRLRTSTDLWFKSIKRERVTAINIEHDQFHDVRRATVVAISEGGARTELTPLSVAFTNSSDPLLKIQVESVHGLRKALGVDGDDNATNAGPSSTEDAKPIFLLPQERLLLHLLSSRYDEKKNVVSESFEASHGVRGRKLLVLGGLQVSAGGFIFLLYTAVAILSHSDSLWPGYVIGMIFVGIGGIRIVQSSRSRPESSTLST
jgi:hypothetical protein